MKRSERKKIISEALVAGARGDLELARAKFALVGIQVVTLATN